jgi:hypothetical protein
MLDCVTTNRLLGAKNFKICLTVSLYLTTIEDASIKISRSILLSDILIIFWRLQPNVKYYANRPMPYKRVKV